MDKKIRDQNKKIISYPPIPDPRKEEDLDDFIFRDEKVIGASER